MSHSTRSNIWPEVPMHFMTEFYLCLSVISAPAMSDFSLKWSAMSQSDSLSFLHTVKNQTNSGIKAGFEDHITGRNIYMLHLISHWFEFTEFEGLGGSLITKWGTCVFPSLVSLLKPYSNKRVPS